MRPRPALRWYNVPLLPTDTFGSKILRGLTGAHSAGHIGVPSGLESTV
jgi:hypothetical protein